MEHRELILAIRDYIDSLQEVEKLCNGCKELQIKRNHGVRGQVMMAFQDGVCRCDEHELMWAYRPMKEVTKIDRPIECILNGQKYY